MQTIILSELCRIVKKVLKNNKGNLSLGYIGKKHGTCEENGKTCEEKTHVWFDEGG